MPTPLPDSSPNAQPHALPDALPDARPDPTAPSTATLRLLGDVTVVRDGGSTVALRRGQARTTLSLLAIERHRTVGRSEIADQLWPAELPPHWEGAVRGVVSKVRAFLDAAGLTDALISTGDGWRLDTGGRARLAIDVDLHRTTIEAAEQVARQTSPLDATRDQSGIEVDSSTIPGGLDGLAVASARLADELAPSATGLWIDTTREGLARLRRRGLTVLTALACQAARPDLAVDAADALVRIDPYSDAAVRALVEALHEAGDRAAAIAHGEAFERRLKTDLGVDAEATTLALIESVRTNQPRSNQPHPDGPRRASRTPRQRSRPVPPNFRDDGLLVGRVAELSTISATWAEVTQEQRARAILLLGEPGAGKSRLAAEAAGQDQVPTALWGRCSPDRRTSFEPVLDSFHAIAAFDDLFGDVDDERPGTANRARLFTRVASAVSAELAEPTVWVIDDLHWANPDTTALLTHVTSSISDRPVLLVLTARTSDGHVAALLEAVARAMPTITLRLSGLDVAEVAELLTAADVDEPVRVAKQVREWTGGNPFFIRELVRSAGPGGRIDPGTTPRPLQSWIDQRIAALDPGPREVLAAAAVLGSGLDLDLLTAVLERPEPEVLDDIEPLLGSGLLVEAQDGADIAFAHALTRDAVVAGLTQIRRHHLHSAAAEAITRLRPAESAATVASHLAKAGPRSDAVPAMLMAGDEALAATAWSSASAWFEEVLQRRSDPGPERIDALIGMGAAMRGLGRRTPARSALEEALRTAGRFGTCRQTALATLRLVGGGARGVADDMADADRAALLRAAIDPLGPDDDDLRIPLQVELALALLLTDRAEERTALAEDALARARSLQRPDLLARALLGQRLAHHGPEHGEVRLADAGEALAISPGRLSPDIVITALMSRHEDALLIGDRALARSSLHEAQALAAASQHPYWRWLVSTWTVLDAIIDGDLDHAEVAAFDALGFQAEHPEAIACLGVNLVDIRLFQGRSDEVVDLLAEAANANPHIPTYRAVLALCLAESAESERATEEYLYFAACNFVDVPDDTNRLLCLAVLADVAATIGDVEGGSRLRELLTPHTTRQVVLNCFGGGGSYWGPVATQLGRLALLCGDTGGAAAHFDAARDAAQAFGAPLALARVPTLP